MIESETQKREDSVYVSMCGTTKKDKVKIFDALRVHFNSFNDLVVAGAPGNGAVEGSGLRKDLPQREDL